MPAKVCCCNESMVNQTQIVEYHEKLEPISFGT